jgi:hypothetical protein
VRSTRAPFRAVQRAKIILLAADGVPNLAIARKLGIIDDTVRKWRDRFAQSGAVACRRQAAQWSAGPDPGRCAVPADQARVRAV